VNGRIVLLHATIVAAADKRAIRTEDRRADRNAALSESRTSLFYRNRELRSIGEKGFHHEAQDSALNRGFSI
jgi:hypothetical protein